MRAKLIALATGGVALLGFGVWLGGQRASAEQQHAPAHVQPIVPRVATMPAVRPAMANAPMPGLAADLRDSDPRVRRNAIAELAASDSPDPATLLAASHDANLDVALAATEGLGALYRDGSITAQDLVARATDPSVPDKVRVVAINGLGAVTSPESAAALADLLHSSDAYARRSAAILMVHQDPTVAMPTLIAALRDADENTRANAREAMRTLARGRDLGDDANAWQRWWTERSR